MDITSLIIMFVGIIIILALYIISRLSRNKLPQGKTHTLPKLQNKDGTLFSSVLDDIPARDGGMPKPPPADSAAMESAAMDSPDKTVKPQPNTKQSTEKKQYILFISGNDEAGLDGKLVKKVLIKNGLELGELDIYHYLVADNNPKATQKISLFRIANGVSPWTLKNEDFHNKRLAGLSIVLDMPCPIDSAQAIKSFVAVSQQIAQQVNGVLKNQQQQLFTPKDETQLLNSL